MQESKKEDSYDYVNPSHYQQSSIEVIDMMESIWGIDKLISYCEMNAFKYRMRLGLKPNQSIERDLEKARWYENKAKELMSMKECLELSPEDSWGDKIENELSND